MFGMNRSVSNESTDVGGTDLPSADVELFQLPFLFDIAEAHDCHETVLSKPYPSDGEYTTCHLH